MHGVLGTRVERINCVNPVFSSFLPEFEFVFSEEARVDSSDDLPRFRVGEQA